MSAIMLKDATKEQKLIQDHKRERDHKHKWAYGEAHLTAGHPSKRPAKPRKLSKTRAPKPNLELLNEDPLVANIPSKRASRVDSDTSASGASATSEPDADVSYSFDAPRGPHQGSQILSMALAKAVERFEIKATEKLVKEEYEIVINEMDNHSAGYAATEEDYELI